MSLCGDQDKAAIFSAEQWNGIDRRHKVRILKTLEKEIAHDLGIKSTPHLVISKDTQILGAYKFAKNALYLSELTAIEGKRILVKPSDKKQVLAKGIRTENPNSNTDTLFTICHELEHAAQYQRVRGKIAWNPKDDVNGILANLQPKVKGELSPYINGDADSKNAYELYQLQPVEYGANQSALQEIRSLVKRYEKFCSLDDLQQTHKQIQKTEDRFNDVVDISETYDCSNIVQDVSHCLQNLFANKQYLVPSALMQDVKNACEASYRYIQSERYQQMEAMIKKEINHELAKQEEQR